MLTMPKLRDHSTIRSRILARRRGGPPRYYADFRDFSDVGGKIQKLSPAGEQYATTSLTDALEFAATRLHEFEARRRARPSHSTAPRTFGTFAAHHLIEKAENGEADEQWLDSAERHLAEARAYFGDRRDLGDVQVGDVSGYLTHLRTLSNGRGGTMSGGTITQYLNSLSSLYRRAVSEGIVPMGHNPVRALVGKPKIRRQKTRWLEINEMARVLNVARAYTPTRDHLALPYFFEILAALALTGCRETEVYGLEIGDVNLERGIIIVQENEWRRLKTENAERPVPIFPQLGEILAAYANGPNAPTGKLFFPSARPDGDTERMITDLRKTLDKLPMPERFRRNRTERELEQLEAARRKKLARWTDKPRGPKPKETREELERPVVTTMIPPLRTKMLRHTYCAARLQTLDHGRPISIYTVAQEMGHGDLKLIKKIYGHLGTVRHRGEAVEFR
jgi:integrase